MNSIDSLTLEAPDGAATERFYSAFFAAGDLVRVREGAANTTGFRGFTVSLVVGQPADADALLGAALDAGAETIKPAAKSLWGYGGTVKAPDGALWKVATSSKKNTRPASKEFDALVLLLGCSDVPASARFYAERGFAKGKSFGSYVEFSSPAGSGVRLALYKRAALAKDAGVPEPGAGSHRLEIHSGAGAFTDPDGFSWA